MIPVHVKFNSYTDFFVKHDSKKLLVIMYRNMCLKVQEYVSKWVINQIRQKKYL